MSETVPQYKRSRFCQQHFGCVETALRTDGLVALHDGKTGEAMVDTPKALDALVAGVAYGYLAHDGLTSQPRKSTVSGDFGCFYVSRRADGLVVVTSDYHTNDHTHPGLVFDRKAWDAFTQGCRAGDLALDKLPVLAH